VTRTADSPDRAAIARCLALRPPHFDDLDPDLTSLWTSTVVVWLEERYGEVRDVQVWTHPEADAGRVAFGLGVAHDALHDPFRWAGRWQRHGPEHDRAWLLRLNVVGDELLPEQAHA
jgi:hypothetical protein